MCYSIGSALCKTLIIICMSRFIIFLFEILSSLMLIIIPLGNAFINPKMSQVIGNLLSQLTL